MKDKQGQEKNKIVVWAQCMQQNYLNIWQLFQNTPYS